MASKYRICEQVFTYDSKKTLIIFEETGQSNRISQTAEKIMSDKNLLDGFNKKDISLIKYIASTEDEIF